MLHDQEQKHQCCLKVTLEPMQMSIHPLVNARYRIMVYVQTQEEIWSGGYGFWIGNLTEWHLCDFLSGGSQLQRPANFTSVNNDFELDTFH